MAQLPANAGLVAATVFATVAVLGLLPGISFGPFFGKSDKEQLQECRAYLDSCEDDYNDCRQTLGDVCDYLPANGSDAYSYCP